MDAKTTKLLRQVVSDPASNVNTLNSLLPALISSFSSSPQEVSEGFGKLVKAMLKAKIIDMSDVENLLMGQEIAKEAKEAKKFVITRFKVLLDNLIDQVTDEDKFDFISKAILELHEAITEDKKPEQILNTLASSSGGLLLGKLLVKAMQDTETLQLHYKQLTSQFMDLSMIALLGLNHSMKDNSKEFKRKTLYSILTEFGVFDEQKQVKTALIQVPETDEEDKEGEEPEIIKQIRKETKRQYENAFITFLSRVTIKQADLVKKIMLEMPKKVLFNFENPLVLSDFLTFYLNQDDDVEL
jgi:hypothetical protein